jgi:hypothetical protein
MNIADFESQSRQTEAGGRAYFNPHTLSGALRQLDQT